MVASMGVSDTVSTTLTQTPTESGGIGRPILRHRAGYCPTVCQSRARTCNLHFPVINNPPLRVKSINDEQRQNFSFYLL